MIESYAIRVMEQLKTPEYHTGYQSRAEAQDDLDRMERRNGCTYEIVYGREYQSYDDSGNHSGSFSELPDPE